MYVKSISKMRTSMCLFICNLNVTIFYRRVYLNIQENKSEDDF